MEETVVVFYYHIIRIYLIAIENIEYKDIVFCNLKQEAKVFAACIELPNKTLTRFHYVTSFIYCQQDYDK